LININDEIYVGSIEEKYTPSIYQKISCDLFEQFASSTQPFIFYDEMNELLDTPVEDIAHLVGRCGQ